MNPKFLATKGDRQIFCDSLFDAIFFYNHGWYVEDLINCKKFIPGEHYEA